MEVNANYSFLFWDKAYLQMIMYLIKGTQKWVLRLKTFQDFAQWLP